MSEPFSLLFLCAGNRFRSPLAAAFVRRLTVGLPVDVASAGTLELGDVPALPEARELGAWCGVDLSSHRARHLAHEHLDGVDLLLGFEQAHVRHAAVDAGASRSTSFTLGELALLLEELGPGAPGGDVAAYARQRVQRADELRSRDSFAADGDIADPLGGTKKVYRSTAADIQRLSLQLVEALFGRAGSNGLVLLG